MSCNLALQTFVAIEEMEGSTWCAWRDGDEPSGEPAAKCPGFLNDRVPPGKKRVYPLVGLCTPSCGPVEMAAPPGVSFVSFCLLKMKKDALPRNACGRSGTLVGTAF